MKKPSQKQGWGHLLQLFLAANNQKKMEQLLILLLTPEEKVDLSTRCLVIKALLDNQLTQREIAHTFHVSISKITRGSNALKNITPQMHKKLKQFFSDSEKDEKHK